MKIFLDTEFNGLSEVPHNALYDAIGNLQHYISMDERL